MKKVTELALTNKDTFCKKSANKKMHAIGRKLLLSILSAMLLLMPIAAAADGGPAEYEGARILENADIGAEAEEKTAAENDVLQNADEEKRAAENDVLQNADGEKMAAKNEDSGAIASAENAAAGTAENENPAEAFYTLIMDNLSEILSLAAFIGSLICAILYKSGLIPLVKNGLGSIASTAMKIKEAADSENEARAKDGALLSEKISELEEKIEQMLSENAKFASLLEGADSARKEQMRLASLMEGELEMLYDIFMSSALPEYEKARVGERVSKMKEVLKTQ